MPALPLTGGCQCGALRYEVSKPPLTVVNCHCKNCQRTSGSAFGTSVIISSDSLTFTKGEPARVEWKIPAGRQRYGLFCDKCGSRIANGSEPDRGIYSLRAGTLDDTSWLAPVGDIWTDEAQPWVGMSATRKQYPQQPDGFGELIEIFGAKKLF